MALEPQLTMQLANGHFHHLTLLKPHPSISPEKPVKASLEAIGKFCTSMVYHIAIFERKTTDLLTIELLV